MPISDLIPHAEKKGRLGMLLGHPGRGIEALEHVLEAFSRRAVPRPKPKEVSSFLEVRGYSYKV